MLTQDFKDFLASRTAVTTPADSDTLPVLSGGVIKKLTVANLFTAPKVTTSVRDANGNTILGLSPTASAVNYLTLANAATGGNLILSATGSDASINLQLESKGSSGQVLVRNNGTAVPYKPGLAFTGDTNTGLSASADSNHWLNLWSNQTIVQSFKGGVAGVPFNTLLSWSSGSNSQGPFDTALSRNAAGVIEVNSGAAGTFRDLKLRHLELADGNIVLGTSTGTTIGTSTSQKLGFFNATPVVRPTGGAATAGATYSGAEQTMLQAVYDAVRTLGLMS